MQRSLDRFFQKQVGAGKLKMTRKITKHKYGFEHHGRLPEVEQKKRKQKGRILGE